jgi:hypothetical protein
MGKFQTFVMVGVPIFDVEGWIGGNEQLKRG